MCRYISLDALKNFLRDNKLKLALWLNFGTRAFFYFEGGPLSIRFGPSVIPPCGRRAVLLIKDSYARAKADMEELSAVGEQVFDAECILNKRMRKVSAVKPLCWILSTYFSPILQTVCFSFGGFLSGKVGVSRQVEGMVIQVSTSGAAPAETMKTTTACRLLLLAKPKLLFFIFKKINKSTIIQILTAVK